MSSSDLKTKYAQNDRDLQAIYTHYGITAADIASSQNARAGVVNPNGTVVVDGKTVATAAHTVGRSGSLGGWAVKINSNTTVYEGTNRLKSPLSAYVFFDINGNFKVAILKVCGNPVPATPATKPVYRCDALSASATIITAGESVTFTTRATAENGASIKSYNYTYGDGASQAGGASIAHSYAKPGTYTAKVAVSIAVDGTVVTAPGDCTVTITVKPVMCDVPGKEQYPKDDPRCFVDKPAISITKTVNGAENANVKVGDEFTYEITVTNDGNVALKNAVVTDKAPAEVTLLKASEGMISKNVWTFTIPELAVKGTKSFKITAKYVKYTAGTHKNTVCVDTPTVPGSPDDCDEATTQTHEDITVCDLTDNTIKTIDRSQFDESHMTLDQSKCGNMHVCIVTDKVERDIAKRDFDDKTMTTDMSKCAPAPTPVPVLPHTGIADTIASMVGLGSVVSVSLAYLASRRSIR